MKLLTVFVLAAMLSACATGSKSGDVYSRDQARREMNVRKGVVESVRVVALEGTKSGVGTMAGAVVGGVAGSSVGQGKGSVISAVVGAVAGGLAGHALEEGATKKPALEITVQVDGRLIVVVQEGAPGEFRSGDQVRIVSSAGETRVTH